MSDYIRREDAKLLIFADAELSRCGEFQRGMFAANETITKMKAADVAPVVPSKWVFMDGEDDERPRCAVCEHIALLDTDDMYSLSNYCPNCGAKMGAEGEPE